MGIDHPTFTGQQVRGTFEQENTASHCSVVERKMSMASTVLVFMVWIREMQDQEITQGHGTTGLDQVLLEMISECGDTQQLHQPGRGQGC